WQSGRSRRTRNAEYAQAYRGFESLPLRHLHRSRESGPLANRSRGRRFGIKLLDQGGAMREDCALVDRTLVGQLSGVERGRIVHQDDARKPPRAAASDFVERAEKARERF